MNNEKCRFFTERKQYNCNALTHTKCSGTDTDCSFYKTDEQYWRDCDRAVIINRRKFNCVHCRYSSSPCKLTCE